jgi:hypothetical protein
MKIKLPTSKLFRFFNRLVYGKNPSNMSKTEKEKVVVENKLRWEDDGGSILEANDSIPQVGNEEKQSLPD